MWKFTLIGFLFLCGRSIVLSQSELKPTCLDSNINDVRESIDFYQGRLSVDSNDQISYYKIGLAYYKLNDYKAAIHSFDKLEILNPEYPSLYSNRGICKLLDNNKLGACNDFGLSIQYGSEPEIMDGKKISEWILINCSQKNKGPFQLLYEGQICPNFTYSGIGDKTISLSDYIGEYTIIDIWATWCPPCIANLPEFDDLRNHYSTNNHFNFISISIDRDKQVWEKFILEKNIPGEQLWAGDDNDEIALRLTLVDGENGRIHTGVPHYIIIDPMGRIIWKNLGNVKDLKKELRAISRRMNKNAHR